jgi:hypothetical protein
LVAQWFVLPALLWPFAFAIGGSGFGGWRLRALRYWGRGRYWVCLIGALILGLALPHKLVNWELTPGASLAHEKWSAGVRFTLAYLLCATAWLVLAVVMRKKEEERETEYSANHPHEGRGR